MSILKRAVARLPHSVRLELERHLRAWQLRTGRFHPDEPEYAVLDTFVRRGDWVLDIGANIGHYTLELARLVGPGGRVIALEPVPQAFVQLAAVVAARRTGNVTLLNAAASDRGSLSWMHVPSSPDGLPSYYDARIDPTEGDERVLTLRVDSLELPHRVSFIKIDVEGHEAAALRGMTQLIERDQPTLVVEGSSDEVAGIMSSLGYAGRRLPDSPNRIYVLRDGAAPGSD